MIQYGGSDSVNNQDVVLMNNSTTIFQIHSLFDEGLDGGSWYSLITKNLANYSLSLKFRLIH